MNTDKFNPIPAAQLLKLFLKQLEDQNSIMGIPRKIFFAPKLIEPIKIQRFGQALETPIGVAAGPHTQMAQNIIAAWLTGGRFIELKTVQTLDELEVSKPCIDMQDEGYNCEWSQELKIHQSFEQYLDAWIIIHVLKDKLKVGDMKNPGFIFNMSVGYNLEGILKDNVQWFFKKMGNASAELEQKMKELEPIYPNIKNILINPVISNNITLSTMHGCPPEEIEKIGLYLIREKKLNTVVKLNPTLLGKDELREILKKSGFETNVPDIAFEHDLKYPDAISIINNLQKAADEEKVHFGIKLTNTLESVNHKDVFPPNEKMMYMSGRALHPVSVNLAAKLQNEFDGNLDISFCGGADAFNVSDLIACGLTPVTVCSDILKPGGYGRFYQYVSEMRLRFDEAKANSIEEFILKTSRIKSGKISEGKLLNINAYAKKVLELDAYRKKSIHDPSIKTNRSLGIFDCIHAPCEDTCPTNQDIPSYNYFTSVGDICKAGNIILQTNPFPRTTGMICDHLCQTKCTRINYDSPVLIREIKRYLAETAIAKEVSKVRAPEKMTNPKKVAIIGAGPSGLSCAYFLAMVGFKVEVYESKPNPGGMVSGVIPPFRLTDEAIQNDVERVKNLGVEVHYGIYVDKPFFEKLKSENHYVYVAAGAQNSSKLKLEGIDNVGVFDPLALLDQVKKGKTVQVGKRVIIIGGGNTAMDVARTAFRLVGNDGKVIIVYRRTIKQMPADMGEIKAVRDEGVEIMELTAPERINSKNGKVFSLTCSRMELGEKDASGRRSPVRIPNSEFELEADSIIPAVGQELAFNFGEENLLCSEPGKYETQIPNVFIGGDALRGASTAINAIGDGRKVAQIIIDKEKVDFKTKPDNSREKMDFSSHMLKRTKKIKPVTIWETPVYDRKNFNLVTTTLSEDDVIEESQRCLLCDEVCSICSTVCPNMANFTYTIKPFSYLLQKAVKQSDGKLITTDNGYFRVSQPYQILNIANFCNECGNCNTFCPSSGAPYKVKPKVYLTKNDFDQVNNGFYLYVQKNKNKLLWKTEGKLATLTDAENEFTFENEEVIARMTKDNLSIKSIEFKGNVKEFSTSQVAVMSVVMHGAKELVFDL